VTDNSIDSRDIFGAEVQYFRLDPRYWERVLDELVDTGIRTVTTYVQWGTHLVGEPDASNPAGVLDFEGRSDPRLNLLKYLDLVHQRNLKMNFRAGPVCCNEAVYGGLPPFIVFDPSLCVWDYQNRTTQGYWIARKEGSQPSYLHPAYLDWCRRWVDALAPIVNDRLHTRGGPITMINLDNEISYIVKDSFLDSDYNPVNVSRGGLWHQFLTERYASARDLPYDTRYASIEDVPPPRAVPREINRDLPYYLDWIRFKTWAMCRYIVELRRMYEQRGMGDVLFMTNLNPHRPEGVPTRMPDFERATRGIVGYDFYRGAYLGYSGYQSMARVLKLMRASMKYVWSAEFMSGLWNLDMTSTSRISDDHMRFMARCALAHGCKAISWFMFHDRDVWGDAPVGVHGHRRSSHAVLKETISLVFDRIRNWDALQVVEDVGIIYDLAQHQHTAIGDPAPCSDGAVHRGHPVIAGVEAGVATLGYEGLFRIVEQTGRQAGVIDTEERPRRLERFKVVILPGSPLIGRATAEALEPFVRKGGRLIVDGIWPTRNELGKPISLLGMDQPPGDEVVRHGDGTVVLLRAAVGLFEPEAEDAAAVARVEKLVAEAAGPPTVRCEHAEPVRYVTWAKAGGRLDMEQQRVLAGAVMHQGEEEAVLFVMNLHHVAALLKLSFADRGWRWLVDLDSGARIPVESGKTTVDIDRKSAGVFRLER
jgi:hypothetical protein